MHCHRNTRCRFSPRNACRRQCWCVVDAVADHRDLPAADLKAPHRRGELRLRPHRFRSAGRRVGNRFRISCYHRYSDTEFDEAPQRHRSIRAESHLQPRKLRAAGHLRRHREPSSHPTPMRLSVFQLLGRRYVDLRQQAWPADSDGLPLHQRPRSATRQRFEIRGWRLSASFAPDFGEDSFGKRMFGVGLDRRGIRDQLVFGRAGRSRDFRGNRASGSRSCRR